MNDKVHTNKRVINFLIDIIAISVLAFLAPTTASLRLVVNNKPEKPGNIPGFHYFF